MKAASSSGSGGGVSGLLPSKALGIILVLQTLVILHVVYILHHPRIFLKEILIRESELL